MIFHSLDFAFFFCAVFVGYWALPHRAQNLFLLLASYFFYGYVQPWFLYLLFASCVVDYSLARCMDAFPGHRKAFLIGSLTAQLGLLGFFKYFGFFVENVWWVLGRVGLDVPRPLLEVVLPVGISFYTFQSLSYTISVYRGTLTARRNFLDFATFLAFFPQLVAGPIERAGHLLPQVESPRRFNAEWARSGLLLVLWGVFKKLAIADNVAVYANKVFSLEQPGFVLLWVGVLAFSVQIYADFSAYSDIARGTARLLGFDLMKNFDHPYLAESPADFWRRWHISLSTWFRDYVYIPLGGNRVSKLVHVRNIVLTFLLSGLWHGASWNFVMWGAYHGLLFVVYDLIERWAPSLMRTPWLKPARIVGFFVLTNIGWLMFRETETKALLRDLMLLPGSDTSAQLMAAGYFLGMILLYSLPLLLHSLFYLVGGEAREQTRPRLVLLQGATAFVLIVLTSFLTSDATSDFIYFQF
jgi:alginate O-acetyltransferase complex protein AlgI